jgi:hypothetical protein
MRSARAKWQDLQAKMGNSGKTPIATRFLRTLRDPLHYFRLNSDAPRSTELPGVKNRRNNSCSTARGLAVFVSLRNQGLARIDPTMSEMGFFDS